MSFLGSISISSENDAFFRYFFAWVVVAGGRPMPVLELTSCMKTDGLTKIYGSITFFNATAPAEDLSIAHSTIFLDES